MSVATAERSKSLIDLEHDKLEPVSKICERITGKRAAPQKVWRWTRKGCRGAILEAALINGVWCTTPVAFAAFIRAQTQAALAMTESNDDSAERSDATKRRLAAAGLI